MATSRNIEHGIRGAVHPQVGDRAPSLAGMLPGRRAGRDDGLEQSDCPTVVALFGEGRGKEPFAEERERHAVRAELRALGAVLLALSPDVLWVFRPDDEQQSLQPAPRAPDGGPPALFGQLGVVPAIGGPGLRGLFVVDGGGTLRFAHRLVNDERITLRAAVEAASRAMLLPPAAPTGASRREFLLASLVTGFALAVADACAPVPPVRDAGSLPQDQLDLTLQINGESHALRLEPRVSLLDALRENLGLTGTKKGCDHGQCGACTLLIDGRRVLSCLTLAAMAEGAKITTIEGLGSPEALHPMQAAFVAEDALQCGYCTPGQIMSAVGLVSEGHAKDDDDIRELMSGNICRCGAYPNIVTAIRRARDEMTGAAAPTTKGPA